MTGMARVERVEGQHTPMRTANMRVRHGRDKPDACTVHVHTHTHTQTHTPISEGLADGLSTHANVQ